MFEQFILGTIQGIAEWLPVSSEGLLILAKTHLFGDGSSMEISIKQALVLHFGTFLAAMVYLRKDVLVLIKALFSYKSASDENQKILKFLVLSTIISGIFGLILLKIFKELTHAFHTQSQFITFTVGILLLITAYLQFKAKDVGIKKISDLKTFDGILLGITQGFAAFPGLSRSGLTVSILLLRKFDKTQALRLSFLMSLPIVLAGNLILHPKEIYFTLESLTGMLSSFLFGLLTIHLMLKVAQKINFGYFVAGFGIITIISIFI